MRSGNDVSVMVRVGVWVNVSVRVSLTVWVIVLFCRNVVLFPVFCAFCIYILYLYSGFLHCTIS